MPVDRFLVEAGHVLLFARSIGDLNPLYTDPDAVAEAGFDGVVAPPTFVQASAQFMEDCAAVAQCVRRRYRRTVRQSLRSREPHARRARARGVR